MSPINGTNTGYMPIMTEETAMSRTHQYRKVMKPLLERKRRARINKCLDELKDLMVYAMQAEGESITKLEKADVLEITVNHLQKLKRQHMLRANPSLNMDRYRAGYSACASEVSRCLSSMPGIDISIGTSIMTHLGSTLTSMAMDPNTSQDALTIKVIAPTLSPASDIGYESSSPSPNSMAAKAISDEHKSTQKELWRPF